MGVSYKLFPPGARKGNRFWAVRGSVDGRRFEAVTDASTEGAATAWVTDYVGRLKVEVAAGPAHTFAEAAKAYIALKNPRKLDRSNIERLVAWFEKNRSKHTLRDVVGADLIAAANELLPGASNAHKNRSVITPGSSILHYAAEQGWCAYQRHRRFKVSRRSPRSPAKVETVRLLIKNTEGAKRLLIFWLYETGQRISDSLRLCDDYLDLVAGTARIVSSKNDDEGLIDLSPTMITMLKAAERFEGGKLFPWSSRHSVYKWLRPLVRALRVSYTPHLSRHALATDLRAQGMDMHGIAQRGIWRDERSAARYVHHRATGTAGRTVDNVLVTDVNPETGEEVGNNVVKMLEHK